MRRSFFYWLGLLFLLSRLWLLLWLLIWSVFTGSPPDFFALMPQGDSRWYVDIVTHGYQPASQPPNYIKEHNWAFFPLYPLLVFLLTKIFPGLRVAAVALLFNQVIFFLFMVVASKYYLITRSGNKQLVAPSAQLKLTAPLLFLLTFGFGSFYFQVLLPEVLLALLVAVSFLLLRQRRFWAASLVAAAASASAISGVILGLVIVGNYLFITGKKHSPRRLQRAWLALGMLTLSTAGCWLYSLYLYFWLGSPFAWLKAQAAWGREVITYVNSVHTNFSLAQIWWFTTTALVIIFLLFWAIYRQRHYGEIFFVAVLLLGALSTSLQSLPCYTFTCLPLLCLLADALRQLPHRYYQIFFALILAALNMIVFFAWLGGNVIAK